jgi:outer membrane PBP1 activator LpoA protein
MGAFLAGSPLCAAADAPASKPAQVAQAAGQAQGPVAPAAPTTSPASANAAPLISLLLPLDSADFAPAASAVMRGCNAALDGVTPALRRDVVRTNADAGSVREAWNSAASRGSSVIVGPLTRDAVGALAASLLESPAEATANTPVTIALNTVDGGNGDSDAVLPARFYSFGLPIENEARAVSNLAWAGNARAVIVVQSRGALGRRSGAAFAAAWMARGGRVLRTETFEVGADLEPLRERFAMENFSDNMRDRPDAIFLAADAAEARIARPYLGNTLPVYATSQINDGRRDDVANLDLGGIHFVDMPWLLQPDHPAVMVYPRPPRNTGMELQRLYALGIDACRLAQAFAARPAPGSRITLDGVTGTLGIITDDQGYNNGRGSMATRAIAREPMAAVFVSGAGIAVEGGESRPAPTTGGTDSGGPAR